MRVRDIKNPEVIKCLINLGFKIKTEAEKYRQEEVEFYCWYIDNCRKNNEAPTIMIYKETGEIFFWMNSTYFYRNIPDVMLELFNRGLIIK